MSILLVTEHYFPKIAGTVSYVENTAVNLAKKGCKVYMLVPATGKNGELIEEKHTQENLILLKLGVTNGADIVYNATERSNLCSWIQYNIIELTSKYNIDIVHLLFGLFIAKTLNTSQLRAKGIKTVHTVHNIPPQECSNSWKGDNPTRYYKDSIRKIGVKLINKHRIKKNIFDHYIVPSSSVKYELSKYVNSNKIAVIGHGGAEYINTVLNNNSSSSIKLLTVGGIVPHKNQHLIPEIAKHLLNQGISFEWDIVGPVRNPFYSEYIKNRIKELKLENNVLVNENVSSDALQDFYNNATIYIQLSSEEGFCMTVLDAIAYGKQVIGTPVGAIPEMLEMVNGVIVENNLETLKTIIAHYIKIKDNLITTPDKLRLFSSTYTWENAAEQLIKIYNGR